jgi:hypothetical protein
LVLVPVLYSVVSRFTGARATHDLDALLDSADDRRFKPLGLRGGRPATAFPVNLLLAPQAGHTGERSVLDALAAKGLVVEPIANSRQVRIRMSQVEAPTAGQAQQQAIEGVRRLIPANGYQLEVEEPSNGALIAEPVAR